MEAKFVNNLIGFKKHVKMLGELSYGNKPEKSPVHYLPDDIVVGQDGNLWKTTRVWHVNKRGDECYHLLWVRAQ